MMLTAFIERFIRTFVPEPFQQLARETGWCKRQGKIDAFEFLLAAVFGQMSALRQTLVAHAQSLSQEVTRQAIDQRFTPPAVAYFQAAFAHVLAHTLDWSVLHPQAAALRTHFDALYLLDSTSFDCPASLQEIFPACGGDGSPANAKVILRYELIQGQLEPWRVLPGKCSDQGLAGAAAERLRTNQLQLQDKGFYSAHAWQAAQQRGAYLLMPLPHALTLWLQGPPEGPEQSLDLAAALAASDAHRLEWPALSLGKPGHRAGPVRLAAFRLSAESAARKRQALSESMRKLGRTASAQALQLAGWLLLITNAPAAKLPTSMMSYLYRIRWQVELIFRQSKWVLRLDHTESDKPERVQCEIWARLIGAVLLFLWHAHASAECWRRLQLEVSFEKLFRIVQSWGHTIARAFWQGPQELRQQLREIWKQILLNGRKERQASRPTSWDNLYRLWLNSSSVPF